MCRVDCLPGRSLGPWLGFLVVLLLAVPLRAAPARYKVSLLTMSPGWHPFERFGHSALAIEDRKTGTELAYNFGTVADRDPDLWKKAVAGRLPYSLSTMNPGMVALVYAAREIRVQELALGDERAGQLVALLTDNLRPERRTYRYDYFEDNCVTRLRDLLDQVTGGALRRALAAPAPRTFRQDVAGALTPVPLLWGLVDLVYGPYTDRPRSRYEALFLPGALHDALAEITLADGARLLAGARTFRGSDYAEPTEWPSARALPLALAALLLLGAALGPGRGRALLGVSGALLAAGLGAVGGLLAWLGTSPHACLGGNANRQLFSPLALLLVAPFAYVALSRRLDAWGLAVRRPWLLVLAGIALAAGLTFRALLHGGAHLLHGCAQAHTFALWWALGLHGALLLALLRVLPARR